MNETMCAEVLIATIMLWVAVFGLSDLLMEWVGDPYKKTLFYATLAVSVSVFLGIHKNVTTCGLM